MKKTGKLITIMPFVREGSHVQIHNVIFDEVMPRLSPMAWVVLCVIMRKTWGFQKKADAISYSQIMEAAGIKNRNAVSRALNELMGIVNIAKTGKPVKWERVPGMPVLILKTKGKIKEPTTYSVNSKLKVEVREGEEL